jgi:hypothetical protein
MAGITLAHAEAQLALYLAAEAAVLQGQSYRINTGQGERELRRANLAEIQAGIALWNGRCATLGVTSTGRRRVIIPAG